MKYSDDKMHTDTQDSIAKAEKIVGAKLELPKKDFHSDIANQPNLTTDENFKYDEDEDISETLSSIKQSEKQYGYRHDNSWNRWGGWKNWYGNNANRYGNNGNNWAGNYAWRSGYQGRNYRGWGNQVENKDWWNQLRKDNGGDGMVPVHVKFTREIKDENDKEWWKRHGYKDRWGQW